MTSVTDTITFVDKVQIAPGIPGLDYLHGDAAGSGGGTPRHNVQAQLMYFNNGLGARLGANWRSGTEVNTFNGDTLHFSSYSTFNLSLFANPGDIPEVSVKHPWLRGTQVRLSVDNVFNSRPSVRSALGATAVQLSAEPARSDRTDGDDQLQEAVRAFARDHPPAVPAGAAAGDDDALIPLRRILCLSALK